jgi:ribonuclease P protein component
VSQESGPRTSSPRPAFAFPRASRVTRGAELNALRTGGRRVRTAHLDVRVAPGPAPARVGIVVPKHKHGSVERNRVKRRLRELARLRLLPALPAGQVWIRARPEAYRASFAQLAADVERAAREAGRIVAAAAAAPDDEALPSPSGASGVAGA